MKLFEKWDVSFKLIQLLLAGSTLYIGHSTYESNKRSDRKTEIVNKCESEIFIPLSLPQSIDMLLQKENEESYHSYTNEIYSASLSDFVNSSSLTNYAKKAEKLQPSLKNKKVNLQEFLERNNITRTEFKPFIINQIRSIQKDAIAECIERRISILKN